MYEIENIFSVALMIRAERVFGKMVINTTNKYFRSREKYDVLDLEESTFYTISIIIPAISRLLMVKYYFCLCFKILYWCKNM